MKFEARKIDLDLELVTLNGEELVLKPKHEVTAEKAMELIDLWTKTEQEEENKVQLLGIELSIVYPRSSSWFLKNFDIKTLSDILEFVAKSLGGMIKNEERSD